MISRKRNEVARYGEITVAKFSVGDAVLINNSRFSHGKDTSTYHVGVILSITSDHCAVPMYHIMYLDDSVDDVSETEINKHNDRDSVPTVSLNRCDFLYINHVYQFR